jgi:hypothetical protein
MIETRFSLHLKAPADDAIIEKTVNLPFVPVPGVL